MPKLHSHLSIGVLPINCLVWLGLIISTLSTAFGQNLIDNPGFEQGTNFWNADAPAILGATTGSHSGGRAGFISNRTADWQGFNQSVAGKLQTNVSYFVSCWVRVGSGFPQIVKVSLQDQEASTNVQVELAQKSVATTNWVYISADFNLSDPLNPAHAILNISGPVAGVVLYADDVVLMPLSGLRLAARNSGVRLGGISSDTALLNDKPFAQVVANEYHIAGAENALKFAETEPSPNSYSFGAADTIVNTAMAAGQNSRGHTLAWHGSVPTWVTNGGPTATQVQAILYNHIDNVVGRYKQDLFCWDAVNEAFNDNGTVRSTVWYNQPGIGYAGQGTRYIEEVYKRVRRDSPDTEIIYNDYNDETRNAKSDAIYAMAVDFKQRGVPLDGIGFQLHEALPGLSIGSWLLELERFAALGLKLHITEMDIRLPVNASGVANASDLLAQGDLYYKIIGAALAFPQLEVIQTWGFSDRYSWVPSSYPGFGAALPLDQNFNRKPAWWAIHDVLANQAEVLPVNDISAGATQVTLTNSLFSAGRARELLANGKGDFITFGLNIPYTGPYDVRIGVQKNSDGGQIQLATAPIGSTNLSNIGSGQDAYWPGPSSFELDLGTTMFTTAGDYAFRFTVLGQNVNSVGYNFVLDYIRLIPTGTDGNQRPIISAIADQNIDTTQPRLFVPFTVSDRETVESALGIQFSSSNAALLPVSRMKLLGGGQHRVLSILPMPGVMGASLVKLIATDAAGIATTNQFTLTVTPPQVPALAISARAGQLVLTWPANGTWNVQSAPALGPSPVWQTVVAFVPQLTNGTWVLAVQETNAVQFFRLSQ